MTHDTPTASDNADEPTDTDSRPLDHPGVDFAAILGVALGLAALGFGTGVHLSLMSVQAAVIDSTQVPLQVQAGSDLYSALTSLQTFANTSLYAAAFLLVAGGLLGERGHVARQIDALVARLESDDEGVSDDA